MKSDGPNGAPSGESRLPAGMSQLPAGMSQPEALKTEDYLPWSRGRGVDVWAMLVAAMNGDLATMKTFEARDPGLLRCEFEYFRPCTLP